MTWPFAFGFSCLVLGLSVVDTVGLVFVGGCFWIAGEFARDV